jgi:hypothetical protein
MRRLWAGAGITAVTVAAGFAAAAPASAAQQVQQAPCSGLGTITIRTPSDNSSDNGGFSAGQIIGGGSGHLIPTSFDFTATDGRTGATLFTGTQLKGGGHANANQPTTTCTITQTASANEAFGGQLPPGVNGDDLITFTILVTAVPKI